MDGPAPAASPAAAAAAAAPPALAHVYMLDAAVDLSNEDLGHLAFDDATQQLLAVKGGHVFAHAAEGGALRWMYPLQDGPPVLALRPSLDNRLLAVQRAPCLLELVDLATGNCFVASTHKGRDRILGFFFTDAPGADVVIATDRGVEMHGFAAKRQGLKLQQRVRRRSEWCLYTHETRMLLVGGGGAGGAGAPGGVAGGGGPLLSAWQFTTAGTVHLPTFELHGPLPAAAAAAREFLGAPPPPAAAATAPPAARRGDAPAAPQQWADAPAAAAPPPSATAATAATAAAPGPSYYCGSCPASDAARRAAGVWLLRMYGRVYLAHAARCAPGPGGPGGGPGSGARLELYRFYSDTLLLERIYDLVDPQVDLSVIDNALVVHYPSAAVAVLADVALPGRQPLTNPLPPRRLARAPPGAAAAAAAAGGPPPPPYASSEVQHAPGWRLIMPNLVLDTEGQRLHRLHLDLAAISDSASDWPSLVAFLQRRRPSPAAHALALAAGAAGATAGGGGGGGGGGVSAAAAEPRALLLGVCRAALQEPLELGALRAMFGQLVQSYADSLARSGGAPPPPPCGDAPAAAALLSPSELASELFVWAHDEEVVDALHLQAAVSEYVAAAEAAGVPPPPALASLRVELLLQQGLGHTALQLLRAQPSALGLPLAARLVAEGACAGGGGGSGGAGRPAAPLALGCQMALEVYARQAAAEARAAARGELPAGAAAAAPPRQGAIAAAAAAVAGVPPAAAAAASSAAALAAAGRRGALVHNETYVRQLIASGQVLKAARLIRDRGLDGAVSPDDLLSAAAARGDGRLVAALLRALGARGAGPLAAGEPGGAEGAVRRLMGGGAAAAAT
ncbi:MAG: hypothetical protein J3K34DRAFT_523928 [Monoraphidium minutum]|nr:MAG: hypothetical protein J3K34DRAFT_523928 [Monoraphidium minutum]